ncbi:bifunctional GTP diphosphokinase/guanosine-3',5'-bis pyrophosphate 3'-pyrophosphohydrolase [Mannheimia bovis]|uniref:bifunctional GTP diphosphokinase/guanosine-3',5'-bis pyrophosphate 3'-pyrophosphohydrolase n=1 Tax=Mannheimia bovis TaxID=2770636 RepID=UPI0024B799E3|nr:bifunctional GTP diphosphokinase/guanosine-3',5'-bis pyrophosphate 3'-pyrophosphohydrolase [Mannheimia bovis]WHP47832.1 bifunctional GTP diphosphokinase/guanosine-3',5'-bis pyrophosphate 3'-pyrophosphohydrolase [Mannheimia bovis]
MYLFEPLDRIIQGYLPSEQIERVKRAYVIARDAHEGQTRSSGEPYITHPVAVASIIAEMKLDHEAVIAALLHDVIEDTPYTEEELAAEFGQSVADIVQGVSKLDKLKFRTRQEAEVANFRKMILAMTKDIRVVLIKLADRTHNMRTLGSLRPDKRRRIAKETLEIYSPLAHRLGIEHIKNELEDLGFEAMHPQRYRVLKMAIASARGHRKELIQRIADDIKGRLEDVKIEARVYGREKHLYSIYQKMRQKDQHFHSILDIYAFRVVVGNVDNCYRVLGQMHALYKPRPKRVKDYIAVPKPNGYQSLHTSMIGPHGVPVEVQIRTEDMDKMADMGVTAHWRYKEGESPHNTTMQLKAQQWLQSIVELQNSAGNSAEFIDSVKSDLFSDDIFVFTPKGRIVELPANATAIDFAYAVHSGIGDRCVGALVDRNPYPLTEPLRTGQTIEIITEQGKRPKASWLNFVVTGKARAKIRQFLKNQEHDEAIELGKRQLIRVMNLNSIDELKPEVIQPVLDELRLVTFDDLLAEIGLGNQMSSVIAQRLSGETLQIDTDGNPENNQPIKIEGVENHLISFAKCCLPIPGDDIIAYVSSGKGLVIHNTCCANVKDYAIDQSHYLPVMWEVAKEKAIKFETEIVLDIMNEPGVLAAITSTFAKMDSNIGSIHSEAREGNVYQVIFQISVIDKAHFEAILRKLSSINGVVKVARK